MIHFCKWFKLIFFIGKTNEPSDKGVSAPGNHENYGNLAPTFPNPTETFDEEDGTQIALNDEAKTKNFSKKVDSQKRGRKRRSEERVEQTKKTKIDDASPTVEICKIVDSYKSYPSGFPNINKKVYGIVLNAEIALKTKYL